MVEVAPSGVPEGYKLGFAGDTFNTAWYLRQLRPDIQTSFFTRIGQDGLSETVLARMAGEGIGTDHVMQMADRTLGLYLIQLKHGERSFAYWREASAARCLADDAQALADACAAHDLIYVSGITLAIVGAAGRARLLDALRVARDAGKRIAFDPNLRPRLWPSTAEMCDAVMAAAEISDIALPSFDDEAAHFGDADPAATLARYGQAEVVIVKDGSGPIQYRAGREMGQVAVQPASAVRDTTAAGDSFNAGYLSSEDSGQAMADRLARAARVAAQVVQGQGALVPLDLARLDG